MSAEQTAPTVHRLFINGEWQEATDGELFEDRNPATASELKLSTVPMRLSRPRRPS